ncbi:calmodulin-binding protein 60 A-like isoform X1 [Populus alba x Populus x berolinensis]|uniref:Calmodulin-binding protein 60 A-like isoform X1 n=1 Tax=Populus alba x Populus x berolinensis TaxID=444605 RepID=A0AAD6LNP1_9ROSI|nr:calmodulin-binding protein 60 A-like isoform X1 [Populus alba x Populus x berolinensis]
MAQKRQPEEGKPRSDGNNSPEEKRRRFNLKSVVQDVMKIQSVQHLLEPILEPLIRRVVKEEVELALRKHLANMKRNIGKGIDSSESRSLKLQFANNLSLPVFTGARIEGEEGPAIKVVLVDTLTGKIVNSGPESSSRVEIVVLEGDFDGDEGENWTPEEFKNNIVREREGKKPLLTGDVLLNLKEGICLVGEISFTDNSSWTRSRKFRLGVRAVDNFEGTSIREAKTESFIVRDHRGELYKKHHPPSLFDEVWRLEKIGKDGAFHKRLSRENITTVKDFLILLFIDPTRLRHADGQNLVITAFEHWEQVISFDDEASLVGGSSQLSDVAYTSSSPQTENSSGSKFLASQKIGGFDYAQPSASSPDIMSSIYTVGGVNGLDDYALQGIENMGLRYDQTLNFNGQVSNSLICDTDSLAQAFCDEEHLRFFDTDLQSQNLSLETQADLQSAVDGFLLARSTAVAVYKAQRRWAKISCVLKWFSVRKLVATKKTLWSRNS